jgi:hypothetical protein
MSQKFRDIKTKMIALKTGQYVPDFQGHCEQKRKKRRDGLSAPAGMQRPRDASSKGCIIQGMLHPGMLHPGTHSSGLHRHGTKHLAKRL